MKNLNQFTGMLKVIFSMAPLLLLSACGEGSGETNINNTSAQDTLIVELYKANFNPKSFEIWKEQICIDDSGRYDGPTISCQKIWIDNFRAVLYKSIDTLSAKNESGCSRLEHTNQTDGLARQNQVEILYFNETKMKLRFHILPGNNLTIGFEKNLKNIRPPVDWDTVAIYRKQAPALKLTANTLKDFITDTFSDKSCGDCGPENHFNISIK